jgi:hypothetical protein
MRRMEFLRASKGLSKAQVDPRVDLTHAANCGRSPEEW